MEERWKRTTVTDNRGNPLTVWTWREYELGLEVNLGFEGGWVFELTVRGRRVGLYPDLACGMSAALSREVPIAESLSAPLRFPDQEVA